ncbi:MAG: TlpA disulfide reductase family protein [bacterium]
MKKYLIVLIGFTVLFSACGKNKVPPEEKSAHVEKKDITEDKSQTNYDIKRKYKTFPVAEKVQQKIERKQPQWGNAPDFTLPAINDNNLTLSSLKGKVIILDFWATWCPPCRAEIPDFIELQNEYEGKLAIVGVCLDGGNTPSVKKFVEEMKINYPIVMGNDRIVQDYGGIRGIPTTFIIDKNGDIKETIVGYRLKNVFEDKIKGMCLGGRE